MNKDDRENDALLPWWVNKTLTPDERTQVDAYLERNEDARHEADLLASIRDSVRGRQQGSPGAFGLRRLQREIKQDRARHGASSSPARWWKPALAAAALVIVIQGGILTNMLSGPPATYEPLGVGTGDATVVQIEFQPDATEGRIRALLNATNARVIDGPGALGIYRIALDVDPEDDEAVSSILGQLNQARDIVVRAARD